MCCDILSSPFELPVGQLLSLSLIISAGNDILQLVINQVI